MEGFRAERADMFSIEPAQLVERESGISFVDPVHVECRNQVLHQEKFSFIAGVPTQEGDVIDNRLRKIPHPHQIFERRVSLTLAHLGAVFADDMGKVNILRMLPAKSLI